MADGTNSSKNKKKTRALKQPHQPSRTTTTGKARGVKAGRTVAGGHRSRTPLNKKRHHDEGVLHHALDGIKHGAEHVAHGVEHVAGGVSHVVHNAEAGIESSKLGQTAHKVEENIANASHKFHETVNDRAPIVGVVEKALSGPAVDDPKLQARLAALEQSRNQIDANNARSWYKRQLHTPIGQKKLPIGIKIFGVLCMLVTLAAMFELAVTILNTIDLFMDGRMETMGTSTIVITWIFLADLLLLDISFFVFGIMLFSGRRVIAAVVIYAIYILLFAGAACSLMLFGARWELALFGVAFGIMIAGQIYLDPNLREERQLHHLMQSKILKKEEEEGVLGRDLSGKGYIKLDFFNLFWIFVVCSFLGDIMESVVHVVLVDPGHWQDRAGLLYGQFSPIYGFGAVLMTLFLNRFYKSNFLIIFFLSAIIGGAFEYFVSWWMQFTYGAVAWDYTGQFLSIGGRTCGWAMGCWGLLGVIWIKLLLPLLLKLINKIPWNWRYSITAVATAFMVVDCIMTLESLDCWYERLAGDPVSTNLQKFYAEFYDNEYMANRFQSMTIDPSTATRAGRV